MPAAFRKMFCLLAVLLFLPALLAAQGTFTAQLSGVVTDSSGGIVAGAKVVLTEDATNISLTAITSD